MSTTTNHPQPLSSSARLAALVLLAAVAILGVAAGSSGAATPATGETTRASVSSSQGEGNGDSYNPSASADGRFVAFSSHASNLVDGDTNGNYDVFVRDLQGGTTERVSVNTSGDKGYGSYYPPSISADGRFVAFDSTSSNLAEGDTNGNSDVFVRDRQSGTTERVSLGASEGEGNSFSFDPSISADGRFVAFYSDASNLVDGDTNGSDDLFVRDRQSGTTERVSLGASEGEGNSSSFDPSISADGRFVAFYSDASNLVDGDTNGTYDVFVRDLQGGTTERVSLDASGGEGYSSSYYPSISADGRFVAFASYGNGGQHVLVRDLQGGTTERVSLGASVGEGTASYSKGPSISADGRFVAFYSQLFYNQGEGDKYGKYDFFVSDRQSGITERVSLGASGGAGNSGDYRPSISADGKFVAFESNTSNLVEGDNNGTYDVFVLAPRYGVTEKVSEPVNAGGTVTTGDAATVSDPVETAVTSPVEGTISIAEKATTTEQPAGYSFFGSTVDIKLTASDGSTLVADASNPIVLKFVLDRTLLEQAGIIQPGQTLTQTDLSKVSIFRNGVPTQECAGATSASASNPDGTPNPCVSDRQVAGDDAVITVLTTQASSWNFGVDNAAPTVTSSVPVPNKTGVSRNTNVTATFSEEMNPDTLTTSTVKLSVYNKKKRKYVSVTDTAVSCDSPCKTVTLDPYGTSLTTLLGANKKYKVTVTTSVKDKAGNALAQNKVWTFTTGSS